MSIGYKVSLQTNFIVPVIRVSIILILASFLYFYTLKIAQKVDVWLRNALQIATNKATVTIAILESSALIGFYTQSQDLENIEQLELKKRG